MRINFNKIGLLLLLGGLSLQACNEDATDISTVTKFEPFTINGLNDKITLDEVDSVYTLNFTFDDKQIIEFGLKVESHGGTATDEKDYSLLTHDVHVLPLQGKGSIEFQVNADVFKEADETVFLTFTSDYALGLPKTKTIEITIKNVGGCPEYIHNDFVGDYEVVSDAWQDWTPGTVLSVTDEGANVLGFKYNCGADAETIKLKIDPATFGISGDKQNYCKYSLPPVTQFIGDIAEATSIVNTCDKVLNIAIAHTDENGTAYGTGAIVLKKK